MKLKNTILLLLLTILLMLFSLITACSNNNQQGETEQDNNDNIEPINETPAQGVGVDAKGFILDNIPGDLNFNGQKVGILYWEDVQKPEFYIEEAIGETVNDAVYERRLAVESRLGVELAFNGIPGDFYNQQNFVNTVQNNVRAGTGEYDIIGGYSMAVATLAYNRCTLNLLDYDIIDFDMPWWPDSLIQEARIGDSLYFASGDVSPNLLYQMYGIFFNKNIIRDFQREDPYDLVLNGKWTLDKLIEMSKDVYLDLNGNSQKDNEDQFGYISERLYYDPLYFSSGLRIIERDSEGMPTLSPGMNGERATSLVAKLCGFIHNGNDTFGEISGENSLLECETIFKTGRGMFIASTLTYAENHLRNVDFEYGILPMPKYTEEQEDYSTCTGFPYTLYGISSDSKSPEAAAAVLEAFASEGYRRVTPAVFETAMKVKYSHDEESALMYDIIRSGVNFDLGRIFTATFNNLTYSMFRFSVADNNVNWVSTYEKNENALKTSLESIIKAFTKE